MNKYQEKRNRLEKRKKRVKFAIRPKEPTARLYLFRSNRYLHSQIIDDQKSHVLCCASTSEKDFPISGKNIKAAHELGIIMAERATKKGVKKVIFDRRGMLYHGKIAEFVDSIRKNGLKV